MDMSKPLAYRMSPKTLDDYVGQEHILGKDKILYRTIKADRLSSIILWGPPGCGKTSLARVISNTTKYKFTKINAVTAGIGDIKNAIEEAKNTFLNPTGRCILFIDEIHTIVGAGSAEGAVDAANILKPLLARGEVQVIGATTLNEYRKYIEKDAALERRFSPVNVGEPTPDETIEILEGIRDKYEAHHNVKITKEAIDSAVKLSVRYINDRFLPDKAIDILDEACSRINLNNKELYQLEILKNQLKDVQEDKEEAASADSTEDYKKAAELKAKECALIEQIDKLNKKMKLVNLTVQDIAEVIESWTKIPVKKITEEETQKLLNLEGNLHQRIIGQDNAVEAVSRAIRRNRAGLKSTKRPPSFIFVGPTGVGKTELAKALAYEMFGNEDSIIRVDMSEYMESHSTSKLIGSPPGYVGYDDAGQLTEKVKRNPYSIILFDEIEKAHPDVFNILLQVLDDGRLTDAQGRTVNFKNTVIIMTSNIGARLITDKTTLGFSAKDKKDESQKEYETIKKDVMGELKKQFRPEFINRIDEIIVFHKLNDEDIKQIIDIMLNQVTKRMAEKSYKFEIDNSVKELIAKKGVDTDYGARPLKRAIQNILEDKIAEEILDGNIKPNKKAVIKAEDDKIVIS